MLQVFQSYWMNNAKNILRQLTILFYWQIKWQQFCCIIKLLMIKQCLRVSHIMIGNLSRKKLQKYINKFFLSEVQTTQVVFYFLLFDNGEDLYKFPLCEKVLLDCPYQRLYHYQ